MKIGLAWIAITLASAACGNGNLPASKGASVAMRLPLGRQRRTGLHLRSLRCVHVQRGAAAGRCARGTGARTCGTTGCGRAGTCGTTGCGRARARARASGARHPRRSRQGFARRAHDRLDKLTKQAGEIDHKVDEARRRVGRSQGRARAQTSEGPARGAREAEDGSRGLQVADAKAAVDRFDHHRH